MFIEIAGPPSVPSTSRVSPADPEAPLPAPPPISDDIISATWISQATEGKLSVVLNRTVEKPRVGVSLKGAEAPLVARVDPNGIASGIVIPGDRITHVDGEELTDGEEQFLTLK